MYIYIDIYIYIYIYMSDDFYSIGTQRTRRHGGKKVQARSVW